MRNDFTLAQIANSRLLNGFFRGTANSLNQRMKKYNSPLDSDKGACFYCSYKWLPEVIAENTLSAPALSLRRRNLAQHIATCAAS